MNVDSADIKNHSILRWLLHKALSNRCSYGNFFRPILVHIAHFEVYIIFIKVSWPSNDDVMGTSNQPWVNQLLISDLLTSFYQVQTVSFCYKSLSISAKIFIWIWYVRNFLRSGTTDMTKTTVLGRTRGKESLTKCIAFQENA